MALRAGYHGVKKSLLAAISNLSGAKIIKSIGDGLKLTSAGKLSCDIDAETMEFKNGKLSSKNTGSGVKSHVYTGVGGSSTEITFDDAPSKIIGIYELGTHGGGYCAFGVGFAAGSCKGVWITPNNNAINGVNLSYDLTGKVLTITGGTDATQRLDATGMDYAVLYL